MGAPSSLLTGLISHPGFVLGYTHERTTQQGHCRPTRFLDTTAAAPSHRQLRFNTNPPDAATRCQPPRLAARPPNPLIQDSRPSFTTLVRQHSMPCLIFSTPSTTASELDTCTTQAKRHHYCSTRSARHDQRNTTTHAATCQTCVDMLTIAHHTNRLHVNMEIMCS